MLSLFSKFRWEQDNWWWELLRFDELGLPNALNIVVPDKLTHFLMCFSLTWMLYRFGWSRAAAALSVWVLMMGLWEVVWDGCFRYGASWRDMVANTLGCLVAYWWLASYDVVGQVGDLPTRGGL